MKKTIIVLSALCLATAANASVTLTFATDLQGFEASGFGNAANTAVTWSADNGGSMLIANNKGAVGSEFSWIAKYFTNGSQTGTKLAMYNELVAAIVNGGTISYDVIIPANAVTLGAGTQPTFAQANFFADNQNGVFDQEFGVPGLGSTAFPIVAGSTTPVSISIQTSGAKVDDDNLAYFLGSTGALQLGFGSNYNNADGFSYYIDNFTVTAIPEPGSVALLGLGSLLLLRRRR